MKKWLVRTVAVVLLALVCVRLGIWQLDRNEQRSERNAVIEANVGREPVPVGELAAPGRPIDAGDQWRTVEVRGHYDPEYEMALRLRPVNGQRGVHALTPLVTSGGAAVLIDRGFVPSNGVDDVALPPPPPGEVTVLARIRQSEEGRGTGGDPAGGAIRYIDVDGIADALPYPLYGAWGELVSQDPPAAEQLQPLPAPEIEAGPHLSYAIQWFIFAVIGVGGFVLLVRAEARGDGERAKPAGPVIMSPRAHPETSNEHDHQEGPREVRPRDASGRQVP